jgi:hypothetical protein
MTGHVGEIGPPCETIWPFTQAARRSSLRGEGQRLSQDEELVPGALQSPCESTIAGHQVACPE